MSNPLPSAPSARPKPRPTTGTARGRAQVPGALTGGPQDDPSGAIAPGAGVAALVDEHVPGDRLPVSELLFHQAGAASPFGDDLKFPLPAGALNYRHP
jgi:hypothetical protein